MVLGVAAIFFVGFANLSPVSLSLFVVAFAVGSWLFDLPLCIGFSLPVGAVAFCCFLLLLLLWFLVLTVLI